MEVDHNHFSKWQENNLNSILGRLKPLKSEPDGIIYQEATAFHDLIVEKFGPRINLIFETDNPDRFSIESRIDINRPLHLLSTYTQIMMLSLVWRAQPNRVYMIGLGGGRMAMVLHHYLPEVVIECTEIDPILPEIAGRYFGLIFDERLKVIVQDGRQYLEETPLTKSYDIILLDAFFEGLFSPYQFATRDFLEMCNTRLHPEGVLMANLIASDPLFDAKIATIQSAFNQVLLRRYGEGDTVVAGSNATAFSIEEIVARARSLQARYNFSFPLVEHARRLAPYGQSGAGVDNARQLPLQDDSPPEDLFEGLSLAHPLFRNLAGGDLCPCNSGKRFRECHQSKLSSK